VIADDNNDDVCLRYFVAVHVAGVGKQERQRAGVSNAGRRSSGGLE